MANITTENLGQLHEKITIQLQKDDYLPPFNKALKEYGKKSNMPGFRKGFVPAGLIKKMYGESVFGEEMYKIVEKELNDYLEKNNILLLGQPLAIDEESIMLDMNESKDYNFSFEVGVRPEVQLPDFSSIKFTEYKIEPTEEEIVEEVENFKKYFRNRAELQEVGEEDFEIEVLKKLKTETEYRIKDIKIERDSVAKEFHEKLKGKKNGDEVEFNFPDDVIEKHKAYFQQMLELGEDNLPKIFDLKITRIESLILPELNEEFYKKCFPRDEIKTYDEFKERVVKLLEMAHKQKSQNFLDHQIEDELMKHTTIQLPEEFLKKWIKRSNEKVSDEELEKDFPNFIKSTKWDLLKSEICKVNKIDVEDHELELVARRQLSNYVNMDLTNDNSEWVEKYVDKMLQDKRFVQEVHAQILYSKMMEFLNTKIVKEEKKVTTKEFTTITKEHHH